MLTLALTETQAYAQGWLNDGDKVPRWYLDDWEWDELKASMELQFENNFVYAAVLDAGYTEPGERTINSEADDRYFDETRQALYDSGRLQR